MPVPVALTEGESELLGVPAALGVPLGVSEGVEIELYEGETSCVTDAVGDVEREGRDKVL